NGGVPRATPLHQRPGCGRTSPTRLSRQRHPLKRLSMSDPAAVAQRQQARQQGLLAGLITLPLRLFGVLCGSLLLSILIECIGMHWFWPRESWHHAQGMLVYELDQLSSHYKRSLLVAEPTRTAHHWVSLAYDELFVKTGALETAHRAGTRASVNSGG